jgi:hypothetical protein
VEIAMKSRCDITDGTLYRPIHLSVHTRQAPYLVLPLRGCVGAVFLSTSIL